jgi:signal transduction histidine kinase
MLFDASNHSGAERSEGRADTTLQAGGPEAIMARDLARAVLAVLPHSIAVLDGDGVIVGVNEAWMQFGYENGGAADAEASVGINYLDVCRAGAEARSPGAQEALTGLREVLAGRLSQFAVEYPCDSPTMPRWFLLQVSALPGAHAGAVVSHVNITQRKALEQRTQRTLAALLAMAEAVVAPEYGDDKTAMGANVVTRRLAQLTRSVFGCERVTITHLEGERLRLDPVVREGWSSEEQRQWYAEGPRYYLSDFMPAPLIAALRAGQVVLNDLTPAEGQGLPTHGIRQLLVAPLRLGARLVGALGVDYGGQPHRYTDEELSLAAAIGHLAAIVLERERLAQEHKEAQARELAAQEVARQLDQFFATAAHDIRSPVTAALGNVQLARMRCEQMARPARAEGERVAAPATRTFEAISAAEESLQRLVRMTDLLFDVARARAGKLELNLQPCDLAAVVREHVEAQRVSAPDRTIKLELLGDQTVPVLADADRLGQVVSNYVTNALKYSRADRPVMVRLEVSGETAVVAVRDEGPGLPPIEQARVWEPFHRVPGIEVQYGTAGSLGLGLHICRAIIERHGGRVGVESQVGHGATFWFSLPVVAATERA